MDWAGCYQEDYGAQVPAHRWLGGAENSHADDFRDAGSEFGADPGDKADFGERSAYPGHTEEREKVIESKIIAPFENRGF